MSPKLLELSGASVERDLLGLCFYSLKKILPYKNQSKITKEWGKNHWTNQVKVTEDKQV